MVIETTLKASGTKTIIDAFAVLSVEEYGHSSTALWIYGKSAPTIIEMPFEEARSIFIESKKRDRVTGEAPVKIEHKRFDPIEVKEHKFQIDIRTSELKGELIHSLQIYANFPVKNDPLQTIVEYVPGVDKYCDFSFNKYEGYISIGKLFNPESVRKEVEESIKNYLSN